MSSVHCGEQLYVLCKKNDVGEAQKLLARNDVTAAAFINHKDAVTDHLRLNQLVSERNACLVVVL